MWHRFSTGVSSSPLGRGTRGEDLVHFNTNRCDHHPDVLAPVNAIPYRDCKGAAFPIVGQAGRFLTGAVRN